MPFSVTEDQYKRVLQRLTTLEENYNEIIVAIQNFTTLKQLNELMTMFQQGVDDVQTTLESLETRVEAIEVEPLE